MDMHSDLLAPMRNTISIFYELCQRNCNFISSCIISVFFWLGPLPCAVFISVEYRHSWGEMRSFVVSVLVMIVTGASNSLCIFSD